MAMFIVKPTVSYLEVPTLSRMLSAFDDKSVASDRGALPKVANVILPEG